MKLDNQQLNALVDDLDNKLFKARRDKQKKDFLNKKKSVKLSNEESKIVKEAQKAVGRYNQLYKSVGGHGYDYFDKADLVEVIASSYRDNMEFVDTIPTRDDIRNIIILATIDAKTVEELVKAVEKKFK